MNQPSRAYFDALEDSKRHHATSKTYSGRFLRPHAPFIKEIIDRLECSSILDYGCGKGLQYEWRNADLVGSIPTGMTIEEYWGVPVTKYDPAYPPFASEPVGKFDLVICTHTLGAIPVSDLPWVIARLHSLASKAVYVAEKIGPAKKNVHRAGLTMPSGWTASQWAGILEEHHQVGIELHLSTRLRQTDGALVNREILGR